MAAVCEPKGMAREYAALACNLYSGCARGCLYCYAPACLHRPRDNFHRQVRPREGIIEARRRQVSKYAGTKERVLLSCTSDPYQPAEEKEGLTRQALEILAEHRITPAASRRGCPSSPSSTRCRP